MAGLTLRVSVLLSLATTVWSLTTPAAGATNNGSASCIFIPVDSKIRDTLGDRVTKITQVVKYTFRFVKTLKNGSTDGEYDSSILSSNRTQGEIFQPHVWTRATDVQGQTLLLLDSNFDLLSLSLLGLGIEHVSVDLTDSPPTCITSLPVERRVDALRHLLLNDFVLGDSGAGSLGEDECICNQWVENVEGDAEFKYMCCHRSAAGDEVCKKVEKGLWTNVLLISIIVIKILAVLYSPCLIPETFYRRKFTDMNYTHKTDGLKLRIVKTMNPELYKSDNPPVRMTCLDELEHFSKLVKVMHTDEPHEVILSSIHFNVMAMELLSEHYVPVSIVRMLHDNLLMCKIRDNPVLTDCCNTGLWINGERNGRLTWFTCVKTLAKLILIGILALPWIVRVILYYQYEEDFRASMYETAENLGAQVTFDGSFITLFDPTHPFFLTIYVCVSIVALIYGFMGSSLKTKVHLTLRNCLRDMRERDRTDVFAWMLRALLLPMKRVGLFGILLIPLYWPLVLLFTLPFLAVSTFPALNLSLRLILHPFSLICESCSLDSFAITRMHNVRETVLRKTLGREDIFDFKKNLTKKDIFIQICIIIGCLVAFWSLTFLIMECLSYYVELLLYTLIGVIVNASATLRYVSLFFLVYIYTKDSLKGVHELYLAYHSVIRGLLISDQKDSMLTVAVKDDLEQENTAFRLSSEGEQGEGGDPGVLLTVEDGVLAWRTSRLLVFLNNRDKPFTPLKFFFETIIMDCDGVPGPLWRNTWLAFYSVFKVLVFLFFVVAVVLAFGNEISTTNQLLAILASGFLPFALRKFVLKRSEAASVDTSSVRFITMFDKVKSRFSQEWPVADIIEDECVKVVPQPARSESVFEDINKRDTEGNTEDSVDTPGTTEAKPGDPEDRSSPVEPGEDVIVEINRDIDGRNKTMDLIVHVSSAEKMKHLVHTCVTENDKVPKSTSVSSFSNPMFAHAV